MPVRTSVARICAVAHVPGALSVPCATMNNCGCVGGGGGGGGVRSGVAANVLPPSGPRCMYSANQCFCCKDGHLCEMDLYRANLSVVNFSQCGCIVCRCALPTDHTTPCQLGCCGCKLCGKEKDKASVMSVDMER